MPSLGWVASVGESRAQRVTNAYVLKESGLTAPYAESRPLRMEALSRSPLRPAEVLVKVRLASLCHSDLSVVNGDRPRPLPMALGHEAVGEVLSAGTGVADLRPGNKVVMVFVAPCGSCRACSMGDAPHCGSAARANADGDLITGPAAYRSSSGEPIRHHLGVSAFADVIKVARPSLVRIDAEIPDNIAALFGCAVLTGAGAVINTASLRPGQKIAVVGLGGVGLSAVMAARVRGASKIVAIDSNPSKHDLALRCGADTAAGSIEDARSELGEVDVVIEATGVPSVLEEGIGLLGRGGSIVAVGLPPPNRRVTFNALQFAGRGVRLLGSYMGDSKPKEDIPRYVDWWRQGILPLELLHTDTAPMAAINEGLDALAQGRVIRRLFRP